MGHGWSDLTTELSREPKASRLERFVILLSLVSLVKMPPVRLLYFDCSNGSSNGPVGQVVSPMPSKPTNKTERNPFRRKLRDSPLQGQYTLEGEVKTSISLSDKIPDNLHTLFVGINPGVRSAQIGHYYAGHSNCFWKLMHASGLWPVPITTENDDDMVVQGFGFTDVAKRPTPGANTLRRHDFHEAEDRIANTEQAFRPKSIVFVSKRAAREYLGKPLQPVSYGKQRFKIGSADVYFMPSTSGQSYADTTYEEKLAWFKRLAKHISKYYSFIEKAN